MAGGGVSNNGELGFLKVNLLLQHYLYYFGLVFNSFPPEDRIFCLDCQQLEMGSIFFLIAKVMSYSKITTVQYEL